VVDDELNEPPQIAMCHETYAGTTTVVVITAKVSDPEADAIVSTVWTAVDLLGPVLIKPRPKGEIAISPLCDPTQGLPLGAAIVTQAEMDLPQGEVTITLEGCDHLGACYQQLTVFTPP
jgi:hypothetical protein